MIDLNKDVQLEELKDMQSYFPHGFKPPIDYKGAWTLNKASNTLERRAHLNRETIGDMKVRFEIMKQENNDHNQKQDFTVSMIGKQNGQSLLDSGREEDLLLIKLGKYTKKNLIESSKAPLLKKR